MLPVTLRKALRYDERLRVKRVGGQLLAEEVENENIGPQAKDYIVPQHPSQSSRSGCRALAWAGERDAVVDWTLCAS